MPIWLDIISIILQLGACFACFVWGKVSGIANLVNTLLEKKIIKESDLDKI